MRISGNRKRVHDALRERADKVGPNIHEVTATAEQLAEHTGMTPSAIYRAIRELKAAGRLIPREKDGRTPVYWIAGAEPAGSSTRPNKSNSRPSDPSRSRKRSHHAAPPWRKT